MACGHCAEKPQCRLQCRMSQCRKVTVQKNVPIVLSSRVTEWHDITTRNNQLNKQLKYIMKIQYYFIIETNIITIVYYV